MRLVHLSDLHFGALADKRPEALHDAVMATRPDHIVVSGDLAQRGTKGQLREAAAFLKSFPFPVFVVPGNHDMPGAFRLHERFAQPWRQYQKLVSADLEPTFRSEDLLMIGLNSARTGGFYLDWSRGRLSPRQMKRVIEHCAQAPEKALRVLVVHHPPAAPPQGTKRHLLDRREALFRALNTAGVDLILSGHFHLSYAVPLPLPGAIPRACVLSVTASATSHRLKGEPNGFHVIDANPNQMLVQAQTWDGQRYASGRSWGFQRVEEERHHWKPL